MGFDYQNELEWSGEQKGVLSLGGGKDDIKIAVPPEFGGHEGFVSPEDMFVGSMNACFMTTFLVFAKKSSIDLVSYKSSAVGYLEKVDGKNVFTKIVVKPQIKANASSDEIMAVVEHVKEYSIVLNSMRTDVEIEVMIVS
ncbi:MAG: OsmC family protein [Methanosarcinaceae archaeon]|nr:OsmC family protein [Methanosarcinaceae archaeon]MDF1534485.1 OsmC family protein [Methanosarcinaceae archaeon]